MKVRGQRSEARCQSHVACGGRGTGLRSRRNANAFAFTLIEIMIVVGIMAVIMAIGIPSVYQQMHKDSMRQVVADFGDACREARARAILGGITTELRIRPREHTISAVEGSSTTVSTGNPTYGFEGEQMVEHPAGGGAIFSAKISDRIMIDFIGVNLMPDLQGLDEVTCLFYKDGTSDELVVLLRSDKGEIRKLMTDVVTGSMDWENIK